MKAPSSNDNGGNEVQVVYVLKQNAKAAKSVLEAANLLNKNFRMVPATNPEVAPDYIALPVNDNFDKISAQKEGPWNAFIQATGTQICPYSTAVLGNNRLQLVQHQTDSSQQHGGNPLTLVQQTILRTVQQFSTPEESPSPDLIIERIRKLEVSVCPKKLEIFGDDRTLVVPPHAFEGEEFQSILCRCSKNISQESSARRDELYRQLATAHNSPRVARRGTVDPNSRIRESGHRLLFPYNNGVPETTGPGSPGWIRVTEQGIKQSFDMTRVMFSRGNISEKIRFGKLVEMGDKVLDMYAGIGYYTLPALIHGQASFVYACEWNEHAANALLYNIKDNQIEEDRVTVLQGDCRVVASEHKLVDMFDRVSLGLLPSSEGGWRTAIQALKNDSGGWLHVHGNVPVKEVEAWALWLCDRLCALAKEENKPSEWVVICDHVEKVKSFAPTVAHYVADVFVGLPKRHPRGAEMKGKQAGVILADGNFRRCEGTIPPPSCALSPDGALSQDWMR